MRGSLVSWLMFWLITRFFSKQTDSQVVPTLEYPNTTFNNRIWVIRICTVPLAFLSSNWLCELIVSDVSVFCYWRVMTDWHLAHLGVLSFSFILPLIHLTLFSIYGFTTRDVGSTMPKQPPWLLMADLLLKMLGSGPTLKFEPMKRIVDFFSRTRGYGWCPAFPCG